MGLTALISLDREPTNCFHQNNQKQQNKIDFIDKRDYNRININSSQIIVVKGKKRLKAMKGPIIEWSENSVAEALPLDQKQLEKIKLM